MKRALIVLVGVLAGCAMGPDYRRPGVQVPAAYEYLPKDVADTINTEWWKQFGDPVLDVYLYGSTHRISREAPVLVVRGRRAKHGEGAKLVFPREVRGCRIERRESSENR